jgi:hypothetical protein
MVRLLVTLPEAKIRFDCPQLPLKGETYPLALETYPTLYEELSKSGERVDSAELHSSTNGLFLFGYTHQSRSHLHNRSLLGGLIDFLIYILCPKKVKICTYPVRVILD